MNKKNIPGLLILMFLMFTAAPVFSQAVTVDISTNTTTIDGRDFYLHKVLKGQTLYSISKAYGVTADEIYEYNPEAKQGLKTDMILKIPVKKTKAATIAQTPKDTIPPQEFGFVFHQIKQGETLYRIMKKYNITLENLKKYNPGLSANLQIGQWIKIPTDDYLLSKQAEQLYDSIVDYKLKKRDTYYKLSKKFKINQAQLEQLNPKLKETGLQKGMVIKVPYLADKNAQVPAVLIEMTAEPVEPLTDSVIEREFGCDSALSKNNTYRIALMMPFFTELEKDIRVDNKFYMKPPSTYKSFRFIHYYEGFLMAVDSLEKQGFKAEIYVYDTKADTGVTRSITHKPEFASFDLIIGPFFQRNLNIVVKAAAAHNTKVVSPFSKADRLKSYSNLFIPTPTRYTQMVQGVKYLSDSLSGAGIYIIHNGKPEELNELATVKTLIKKYSLTGNLDTNNLHIYNYKNGGFKTLMAELDRNKPNVVINLVNDEAYISSFVRQLNQLRKNFDIILMGSEDRWKKFKTLENEYLVNLKLLLVSPGFIDYRQNDVQIFTHKFHDEYNADPNMMAFKGFDQTYYFLSLIHSFGSNFTPCMKHLRIRTLQNDYDFVQTSYGSWANTYANIYQYYDYQLIDKKRNLTQWVPPVKEEKEDDKSDKAAEDDSKTKTEEK